MSDSRQERIRKLVALFVATYEHPFEVVEGQGFNEMISHCCPYSENQYPPLPSLERFYKSIARFVVIDGHPIDVVQGEGFIQLMSYCFPKFELPSAQNLSYICQQLYLEEKFKLIEFMKTNCQSACLTVNSWKAPCGTSYLSTTAHFIDKDWKLQRKVLSFRSGYETGEEIDACLEEWGIKKVLTILMDKKSSDEKAIAYVKKKLVKQGRDVFSGCKYLEVTCIVHLINSAVDHLFDETRLSVIRVRELVKYCGPKKKFKECVEAEKIESTDKLCLDIDHLWNSTYLMLCRAEKHEKAFIRYSKLDPSMIYNMVYDLPNSKDWSIVRKLIVTLKPIYNMMKNISESWRVTGNDYWANLSDLYAICLDWLNGGDSKLKGMANCMILELEDNWVYETMNKLVYIAAVLDPRKKFKALEYDFARFFGEEYDEILLKNVKEEMFELFDEYKDMLQVTDDKKSELELYLNKPIEDDRDNFDILEWWKFNSENFPIMSHMARDILAIPKSAVCSDNVFNTRALELDKAIYYSDYFDCKILQAQMCGQDWLRNSPPCFDIAKKCELKETIDEEIVADFGSSWGGGSDIDGDWSMV